MNENRNQHKLTIVLLKLLTVLLSGCSVTVEIQPVLLVQVVSMGRLLQDAATVRRVNTQLVQEMHFVSLGRHGSMHVVRVTLVVQRVNLVPRPVQCVPQEDTAAVKALH